MFVPSFVLTVYCNPGSVLGYSKAGQLHCWRQRREWKMLWLARSQLQVNTPRDSATAVPFLKYVFISPDTPHAQSEDVHAASSRYHITFTPSIYSQLANFSQRVLTISDTAHTQFRFYFCTPRSQWVPIRLNGTAAAGISPALPE